MVNNNRLLVTKYLQSTGNVSAHPNGFGFIRCENDESFFVPPALMKQFIPGDLVSFNLSTIPRNDKFSVETMSLIERKETFWLGEMLPNFHGKLEFKSDDACHVKLQLPYGHNMQPGDVFQVCVAAGTDSGVKVDVSVVGNLGRRNAKRFDADYASSKHRLPMSFPQAVLDEAKQLSQAEPFFEDGMLDLRHLAFITIDGEGTRDFDDAIFSEKKGETIYLKVAIADVSRYVKIGSALDVEARLRGTTVYFPDRVIPMLPESLSNGLCSINPGVPRAVIVCSLVFSENGDVISQSFCRGLIQSHSRLTYDEVTAYLSGEKSFEKPVQSTIDAIQHFYNNRKVTRILRGLMEQRGREPKLLVTDDGDYTIAWEHSTIAHAMVEECMLAANCAAAEKIPKQAISYLFRHHQGVDPVKWIETRLWLSQQGIDSPEFPSLEDMRALLLKYDSDKRFPSIEWRVRRSFAPAVYDELLPNHFTLGFSAYTHFTSPIRRYSDLVVHRLLMDEITSAGHDVAKNCTDLSRRAQSASRYPWDRIKRRALWQESDKNHSTRIAVNAKRGLKVIVDNWETAVFISSASLMKAGFVWDEDAISWLDLKTHSKLDVGQILSIKIIELKEIKSECELEGDILI